MEPSTLREKDILAAVLKEYERVATDIRTLESQNDKIVGFGLTIIGAGAAYGLQQHLIEIFVILPFIFVAVFLYAVLQYHNVFWLGGYKKALEEYLNQLIQTPVFVWETIVARDRTRVHVANFPLVAIYVFLLVTTACYSIAKVSATFGFQYGLVQGASLLVFFVVLLLAIRRTFSGFDKAYVAATEALLRARANVDIQPPKGPRAAGEIA